MQRQQQQKQKRGSGGFQQQSAAVWASQSGSKQQILHLQKPPSPQQQQEQQQQQQQEPLPALLPAQHRNQQQQQQAIFGVRTILPNRTISIPSETNLYTESLLRKRERNKLAARRKRDRKKKRLEALEKHEKELLSKRQVLEAELRVYREQAAVARENEVQLPVEVEEEISCLREAVDNAYEGNNSDTGNQHSLSPVSRRRHQSRISSAKHRERQQNRVAYVSDEITRLQEHIKELEEAILEQQKTALVRREMNRDEDDEEEEKEEDKDKEKEEQVIGMEVIQSDTEASVSIFHNVGAVVQALRMRMELLSQNAGRIHIIKEGLKQAVRLVYDQVGWQARQIMEQDQDQGQEQQQQQQYWSEAGHQNYNSSSSSQQTRQPEQFSRHAISFLIGTDAKTTDDADETPAR
ncbi:hypothetical protein GGH99_000084 [Coemansia sp. RSA 1285]|nr:hypothetical protein GGH99_000084 [Coemansia sp. RSA 1285]